MQEGWSTSKGTLTTTQHTNSPCAGTPLDPLLVTSGHQGAKVKAMHILSRTPLQSKEQAREQAARLKLYGALLKQSWVVAQGLWMKCCGQVCWSPWCPLTLRHF